MKRYLIPLTLALLLAVPAFAGEHEKCDKPVQDCLNSMVAKLKSTGFIGVEIEGACDKCAKAKAQAKAKGKDCDKCAKCPKCAQGKAELRVTKIIKGTPAEKAGIQVGDILSGINGIKFGKDNDEKISKVKVPGNKVTCNIKRNGVAKDIKLTLVPMPADIMAKYIGEHMMAHAKADKDSVANGTP